MNIEIDTDIVAALQAEGCEVTPCGSRVTCDPPPVNTDQDYLVLVPPGEDDVTSAVGILGDYKFLWESSEHYQTEAADGFMSWRKDYVNMIVTSNPEFAWKHRAATALCKRLNLQTKADRIALFQAVLYGNDCTSNETPVKPLLPWET